MGSEQYGPSWQDAAEAAAFIWDRYGYRVELKFVQSVRRLDGKGNSAWQVVASLEPREGRPGRPLKTTESFGQGGTSKTAPQAVHRCCMAACEVLDARERDAAKQAAF